MPIAGGILVAGTAAHCLSSAAGMLRFLARLSGRRRHVRRSTGSCAAGRPADEARGVLDAAGTTVPPVEAGDREAVSPLTPVVEGDARCGERGTTGPDCPCHRRLRHHRHRHSRRQCHCRRSYHDRRAEGRASERSGDSSRDAKIPGVAEVTEVTEVTDVADVVVGDDDDDDDDDEDAGKRRREWCRCRDRREFHQHDLHHHHRQLHQLQERLRDERLSCDRDRRRVPVGAIGTVDPLVPNRASSNPVTAASRGCRIIPPYLATLLLISYTLFGIADACSSRSTPKPRPPAPTPRPNITFHMYTCPPDYAEWYCLNGATCFTVKIVDSLLYNCLCANGYIGQRCEFKDLDGSYLPSRQRVMLETASIAGGATIAVFLVVIICIAAYIHCKRKQKELRTSGNCVDTVDGPDRDPELRPFSNGSRSLKIFMAKNPNGSTAIEQTRMPGWNAPEAESMRLGSISEGRRSNQ